MTMITESRAARLATAEASVFTAMMQRFAAYRSGRRTLRELGAMDDYFLRDIGLTRADVMQAADAGSAPERMTVLHRARSRRSV